MKALTNFEIINRHFFFIDSSDESLNNVETHLYGYHIEGGQVFDGKNESIQFPSAETVDGSFVFVEKAGSKIIIKQDYIGTYGLFLFKHGKYFALSNSFLMLLDNVKTKFSLSLNDDYINHIFLGGKNQMGSLSLTETLINEIELLPRVCKVVIDIETKQLDLIPIHYDEYTVPINSPKALEILDQWVLQYTSIIQKLYNGGGYIQADLSGGTDSRNVLPLFLMSGVDLDGVKFISKNNAYINEWGKGVVTEDFEIAAEIARYYNFSINKETFPQEILPLSVEEVMNNSFYTKLGFHTPMYVEPDYCLKPVYYFTGAGGEIIRGYGYDWTVEGFVGWTNLFRTVNLGKSMRKILMNSLQNISRIYGVDRNNLPAIMSRLYRETRTRNHYGGAIIEAYLANKIVLAPLMDHNLSKIQTFIGKNSDPKLLYAIILTRYQKDLLNFRVQGGRTYNKETIALAEQINSQHPINKDIKQYKRVPAVKSRTQIFDCRVKINYPEGDEYFLKIVNSEKFKSTFTSYFPEEVYYKTKQFSESQLGFPLMPWYHLIAATKGLMDVRLSRYVNQTAAEQYFASENKLQSNQKIESQSNKLTMILNVLKSAEIYLLKENMLSFEDFAVTVSDENARLLPLLNPERTRPIGYSLGSFKQSVQVRFRCKTEGNILIVLSCKDVVANNGKMPIKLDYTYLSVGNKIIIADKRITAKSTEPFTYQFRAGHNVVYDIVLRWSVHNYGDKEFLNIIENIIKDDVAYNLS